MYLFFVTWMCFHAGIRSANSCEDSPLLARASFLFCRKLAIWLVLLKFRTSYHVHILTTDFFQLGFGLVIQVSGIEDSLRSQWFEVVILQPKTSHWRSSNADLMPGVLEEDQDCGLLFFCVFDSAFPNWKGSNSSYAWGCILYSYHVYRILTVYLFFRRVLMLWKKTFSQEAALEVCRDSLVQFALLGKVGREINVLSVAWQTWYGYWPYLLVSYPFQRLTSLWMIQCLGGDWENSELLSQDFGEWVDLSSWRISPMWLHMVACVWLIQRWRRWVFKSKG